MADPLTLTLLAIIAALLKGDRGQAEQLIGGLTPLLEVGAQAQTPELVWEGRAVSTTPQLLYGRSSSPRRRVVIWNTTASTLRVANSRAELDGAGGGQLRSGAILIDEPPNPHGGEWWAVALTSDTIPTAQLE